jgi:hypothetical protein
MRLLGLFFVLFWLACSGAAPAQQVPTQSATVQKDPQALSILTQALNVAGGTSALATIQDFSGTGTVNYYWGDGEQGTVVVKGRGAAEFRVDATLPEGVRTWAVCNGAGFVAEASGSTRAIAYENAVNMGSLTFPYAYLTFAEGDPDTNIAYVGLEVQNGAQVQHIQFQKMFASDEAGVLSKLTVRDFYFDAMSLALVSTKDMVHPKDKATIDGSHEVDFSNYQKVNGILVPYSVSESVDGRLVERIELNQFEFNVGLQDSSFTQ